MKRLLFILLVALGAASAVSASDDYAHDASVLPEAARSVIADNFDAMVSVVKIETTLGRVSEYEVILTDGTEISFNRNGEWDNVEVTNTASVPDGIVPRSISNYVKKNQPGMKIVGIDKERRGYEVDLSNGLEIQFDKEGRFLRYDDDAD